MKYSLSKRRVTLGANKDKELYFAKPLSTETATEEHLMRYMEKHTTVSRADIFSVLSQLSDAVRYLVGDLGMTVEFGEFGYFRPTFRSEGVADAKAFDPEKHINSPQIAFMMKRNFKKLNAVRYERVHAPEECKSGTPSTPPSGGGSGTPGSGSGGGFDGH